jgi:hypothetical protein
MVCPMVVSREDSTADMKADTMVDLMDAYLVATKAVLTADLRAGMKGDESVAWKVFC